MDKSSTACKELGNWQHTARGQDRGPVPQTGLKGSRPEDLDVFYATSEIKTEALIDTLAKRLTDLEIETLGEKAAAR